MVFQSARGGKLGLLGAEREGPPARRAPLEAPGGRVTCGTWGEGRENADGGNGGSEISPHPASLASFFARQIFDRWV